MFIYINVFFFANMLLHILILQYIGFVLADRNIFSAFSEENSLLENGKHGPFYQYLRKEVENDEFPIIPTCEQMGRTVHTPFIVIILFKTSGRFLGLGSIVGRRTVLTAGLVVDVSMRHPNNILVLAGRLNPWWGRESQVIVAKDILQNPCGLAIILLKSAFKYTKNIRPIELPKTPASSYTSVYDKHWGVFGIIRSSWNVPGEPIPKTSIYVMKVETETEKKPDWDECRNSYLDMEFNTTVMVCTFANTTFCWGSIGSPLVAVELATDKLYQIGVLIKTTLTEVDKFHVHVRVSFFNQWISSFL